MEYVTLGRSGLRVSTVCLGTMSFGDGRDATGSEDRPWTIDDDVADEVVRTAAEAGVQFIDTADVYSHGSSEEVTGRLVAKYYSRDEAVVATKVFMPMGPGPNGGGLSRKHIASAIDASLRRLNMDYVDLYQIHRFDPSIPIEETMGALHEVVASGKARYIGASSMHAWQFAKAQHAADAIGGTRFISMQNHHNLLYREEEREMIPQCIDMVDVVEQVAADRGVPMAQVALAWLRTRPGVTAPIVGVTKVHHLTDALASLDLALTDDEVRRLEAPYVPHGVLGHV